MAKNSFTASGTGDELNTSEGVVYYADFTTGTGVGSARLQVKINGEWLPADDAVTATMTSVEATEASKKPLTYRWNVTRTSGTIHVYLE